MVNRAGTQSHQVHCLIQETDKEASQSNATHHALNCEGCGSPGEGVRAVSLQEVTFKLRPQGQIGVSPRG